MSDRLLASTPAVADHVSGQRPKVVIVLVHYENVEQTLDCIASLKELGYPNFEIVIVDNSPARSLRSYTQSLRDVKVLVAKSNGGYTGGNNLGIAEALAGQADYVHVLNPDTLVLEPTYLARLVDFMEQNARVGVVGPRVHLRERGLVQNTVLRFPWLWRRLATWLPYRLGWTQKQSMRDPLQAEALNGVCLLFRSEALRQVGLFDEATFAYIEDIDWSYRAAQLGWQRVHLPLDAVLHLQKETGYELGGIVDFLLKRNTLYFLLKTNHHLQAGGYTAFTLALGFLRQCRRGLRVSSGEGRWFYCLTRSYMQLWSGRIDQAMGPPPTLREGSLAR